MGLPSRIIHKYTVCVCSCFCFVDFWGRINQFIFLNTLTAPATMKSHILHLLFDFASNVKLIAKFDILILKLIEGTFLVRVKFNNLLLGKPIRKVASTKV